MASHIPFRVNAQGRGEAGARFSGNANTRRAIHILASGCDCSRRVAAHILQRASLAQLSEGVLLIGSDPQISSTMNRAGVPVQSILANEAANRNDVQGVVAGVYFA